MRRHLFFYVQTFQVLSIRQLLELFTVPHFNELPRSKRRDIFVNQVYSLQASVNLPKHLIPCTPSP